MRGSRFKYVYTLNTVWCFVCTSYRRIVYTFIQEYLFSYPFMVFYVLYDACGGGGGIWRYSGHHNTRSLAYEVYRESRRVDDAVVYVCIM